MVKRRLMLLLPLGGMSSKPVKDDANEKVDEEWINKAEMRGITNQRKSAHSAKSTLPYIAFESSIFDRQSRKNLTSITEQHGVHQP